MRCLDILEMLFSVLMDLIFWIRRLWTCITNAIYVCFMDLKFLDIFGSWMYFYLTSHLPHGSSNRCSLVVLLQCQRPNTPGRSSPKLAVLWGRDSICWVVAMSIAHKYNETYWDTMGYSGISCEKNWDFHWIMMNMSNHLIFTVFSDH